MIKMFILLVILVSIFASSILNAQEVPFTKEDRDRLRNVELKVERLETRLDEGLKSVNQRIDGFERSVNQRIDGLERSVNQRIDGLQNLMYVVISAIFVQIVGVVGFVLWDRRTALAPAVRKAKELEEELATAVKKTKELEEREAMLENAIKDYARQEPRLADALRSARLL